MRGGIFINDDFGNFYFNVPIEKMNEEGLKEQIDFYSEKGGVDAVLFNLNASRAFYRSKVLEPIWEQMDYADDGRVFYRGKECGRWLSKACLNMRELNRNVPDPIRFRRDYCHERGVDFFLSMRPNDMHGAFGAHGYDPTGPCLDRFLVEHDDYRRSLYRRGRTSAWWDETLDYGIAAVRDHYLALAEELFSFDPDGFEVDFMRHLPFFRVGYEEASIPLMNDFMRKIRAMADESARRSGRPVRVVTRVPTAPDDAFACGFDVATWAKEGLVDVVVPSPSFASNESDIPLEIWRRMLPDETTLAPCLEINNRSAVPEIKVMRTEPAIDRGFASMMRYKGADTIYLYNHFPYGPDIFQPRADMQRLYRDLSDRRATEFQARRHLVTYRDNVYVEGRFASSFMPDTIDPVWVRPVRLNVGGATRGRSARAIIGYGEGGLPELRLNTTVLRPDGEPAVPFPRLPSCDAMRPVSYPIPAGVLHDGLNTFEFFNETGKAIRLFWMEIDIAPLAI